MDRKEAALLIFLEELYGEKLFRSIVENADDKRVLTPVKANEEILGVKWDEFDKRWFVTIPSKKHAFELNPAQLDVIKALMDLFWYHIRAKHRVIHDRMGIREGWVLVGWDEKRDDLPDIIKRLLGD